MKQISSSLSGTLTSNTPSYIKKLLLYPRLWDNSQNKYTDGPACDITPYLISCATVKWKLDNEGYGVWNTAGLPITLTDNAPFLSGQIYGARAEVYCGALCGEIAEYVKIFRGFILREPCFNKEEHSCIIYLSGELALLSSYKAEELSVLHENILISSRPAQSSSSEDNDYLVFTLPSRAVGAVLNVLCGDTSTGIAGATELKEVNSYEVSSLNSYKYPAKITLLKPLAAGKSLWVSYRCWHTDKSIEWAVEQTAALCGYTQNNAEIQSVDYEGLIEAFFKQPSDADFTQGSWDYAEVSSSSVKLPSSFLSAAQYDWHIVHSGNVSVNFTPSSISLGQGTLSNPVSAAAPSEQAYGTWEIETDSLLNEDLQHYFYYVADNEDFRYANGYCFTFTKADYYRVFFSFYKVNSGSLQQMGVKWFDRQTHTDRLTYRISRDENGTVRLFVRPLTPSVDNWIDLGIVFTDNTYTTCTHHIVEFMHCAPNTIYNIRLSPQAALSTGEYAPYGSYLSPVIDGGSGLCAWTDFTASQELNDCSGAFFSRSKNNLQDSWGAWHSLTSGCAPQETGRYLQLKWYAQSDQLQTKSPKLNYWQVDWEGEGVNIAMLNTGGASCKDIITELAVLSGYQIGFTAEGKFFFKHRPALTSPVLTIDKNDILSVESINNGADKLYNRVCVNFGNYSCCIDEFTQQKPRPNLIDKYGVKELVLSSGTLLPAHNANLARACAPAVFREAGKLKKRAAVLCRFLPQIDLGDVISVNYGADLSGNMLVEGLEFDLENWVLRLDLCSWD